MTKYILHGGYTRYDNELNRSFFHEVVKDVPDEGIILIVLFARDEEKVEEHFADLKKKFNEYRERKSFHYVKATKEDFLDQVKSAHAIYIHGGNTKKLKKILKEYPEFSENIKGKTVAGVSAGAYVLSKYYYTHSQNKVLNGLGVLPVRVACHYQSEIHPSPDDVDPVSTLEEFDNELELIILKDCEWKVITI